MELDIVIFKPHEDGIRRRKGGTANARGVHDVDCKRENIPAISGETNGGDGELTFESAKIAPKWGFWSSLQPVARNKDESLEFSQKDYTVQSLIKEGLEPPLATIISGVRYLPPMSFPDVKVMSAHTALVVGFAVNIYMAANKHRFGHDEKAKDPSFQNRLKFYISDMEEDLRYRCDVLELDIARLGKQGIEQCVKDLNEEYWNYEKNLQITLTGLHWDLVDLRLLISGGLLGPTVEDLSPLRFTKRLQDEFQNLISPPQKVIHAFVGNSKSDYREERTGSTEWCDLWHFMCAESENVRKPYHFRVIGSLMKVISRAFNRVNNPTRA
ncbi:hypothetical protein JCM33374_g4524 [Metschnikowia sp. JCM 33374]|nr:hypothetical protein JCM33374_g4524 [Metschnikowia sp. JCM 33374]